MRNPLKNQSPVPFGFLFRNPCKLYCPARPCIYISEHSFTKMINSFFKWNALLYLCSRKTERRVVKSVGDQYTGPSRPQKIRINYTKKWKWTCQKMLCELSLKKWLKKKHNRYTAGRNYLLNCYVSYS